MFTYGMGALLGLGGVISGVIKLSNGGNRRTAIELVVLGAFLFAIDSWAVYDRWRHDREAQPAEGFDTREHGSQVSWAGVLASIAVAAGAFSVATLLDLGLLLAVVAAACAFVGVAYVVWPRLFDRLRVHS